MDKTKVGLYNKFIVTRTDGKSEPGQKHDGCDYFVLDLTHDPFAMPALRAYAAACRGEYPALAVDLDQRTATDLVSVEGEQQRIEEKDQGAGLIHQTIPDVEGTEPRPSSGRFFILIPEGRRCEKCGQPEGVQLHVSRGGYSVTSGYEHTLECPTLRCEHGTLHSDDCDDCEAIALAQGTDDTCGPCCSGVHEQCEGSGCICDHEAKA